tara:strand:- start:347 stop:928 length:582 start_codon:yes stop_codon:yes gene_type:complete
MRKILIFIFLVNISLQNNSYASEILPIKEGDNSSKIKLIIYESLTCSHCANFHNEVYPELKKEFIDTGLASIEFRNFPLDLAALNASKLAHCKNNGSSELLHFLYKNQTRWIKGNNIIDLNNNLKKIINESGIALDFESCVNNKKIEDFILEERIDGSKKYSIDSTPTLIINGEKFDKKLNFKNLEKILKKMI